MTDPQEDDLTLVIDRNLAATPHTLWRCWTEPDLLKSWFAPDPVKVTHAEIDAVSGGIFNVVMQMPGQDPMDEPHGCVLLAEPHTRLVWTAALGPGFRPNPPHEDPDSFFITVDLSFAATEAGTRYRATALHSNAGHRNAHEAMGFHTGWNTTTNQPEKLAQSL